MGHETVAKKGNISVAAWLWKSHLWHLSCWRLWRGSGPPAAPCNITLERNAIGTNHNAPEIPLAGDETVLQYTKCSL
jgi:hypothetical protein